MANGVPPAASTIYRLMRLSRKTPFTLATPFIWLTVGLNVALFVISSILIWSSHIIHPWIGMAFSIVFLIHTLGIFIVATLEVFSPVGGFPKTKTWPLLFGLVFLYASIIAAFANMYGSLNRIQNGAFGGLDDDFSLVTQWFRSYYLSVDIYAGLGSGAIVPASNLSLALVGMQILVQNLTVLFILGNMMEFAIDRKMNI